MLSSKTDKSNFVQEFIQNENNYLYDVILEFRQSKPCLVAQVRRYKCKDGLKVKYFYSFRSSDSKTVFEYFYDSRSDVAHKFKCFVSDLIALDYEKL